MKETKALLTDLGFTINEKKSVEHPTQQIVMLGFILDSVTMSVTLTPEKCNKITDMCLDIKNRHIISIRHLAQIIGTLCSAFAGVEYGPLHYRGLERVKCSGLKVHKGNFDGQVTLSQEAVDDLDWWIANIYQARKLISRDTPDVVMETDASTKGWGAFKEVSTGGRWDSEEAKLHINCLELLAAFFGLKCFCSELRDCHVRIMVDNTTAVAYINAMRGMRSRDCDLVATKFGYGALRGIFG